MAVTNPVCMIIKDTGLETERRRYFASVGNRTALLRVFSGQSGINISQRHRTNNWNHPAPNGNTTDAGQFAGNNAIPLPIILPATTPVQANSPIFLAELMVVFLLSLFGRYRSWYRTINWPDQLPTRLLICTRLVLKIKWYKNKHQTNDILTFFA